MVHMHGAGLPLPAHYFHLSWTEEGAQVVTEECGRRGADTTPGGIPDCVLKAVMYIGVVQYFLL